MTIAQELTQAAHEAATNPLSRDTFIGTLDHSLRHHQVLLIDLADLRPKTLAYADRCRFCGKALPVGSVGWYARQSCDIGLGPYHIACLRPEPPELGGLELPPDHRCGIAIEFRMSKKYVGMVRLRLRQNHTNFSRVGLLAAGGAAREVVEYILQQKYPTCSFYNQDTRCVGSLAEIP